MLFYAHADVAIDMEHVTAFQCLLTSMRMTRRLCPVVEYTQTRVKTSSKLTKLKIKSLIKEYSGE